MVPLLWDSPPAVWQQCSGVGSAPPHRHQGCRMCVLWEHSDTSISRIMELGPWELVDIFGEGGSWRTQPPILIDALKQHVMCA